MRKEDLLTMPKEHEHSPIEKKIVFLSCEICGVDRKLNLIIWLMILLKLCSVNLLNCW